MGSFQILTIVRTDVTIVITEIWGSKLRLTNLFLALLQKLLLHFKVKNVKVITAKPKTLINILLFAKKVLAGNSNSLVSLIIQEVPG